MFYQSQSLKWLCNSWKSYGMYSNWKMLGKIVLCDNNFFITDTKKKKYFTEFNISFTMIIVFKQIYNMIILRQMTSDITQRHRKCGWR